MDRLPLRGYCSSRGHSRGLAFGEPLHSQAHSLRPQHLHLDVDDNLYTLMLADHALGMKVKIEYVNTYVNARVSVNAVDYACKTLS